MSHDTKELLSAHHAAVLRELDGIKHDFKSGIGEIKLEISGIREKQVEHANDDTTRFGSIDRGMARQSVVTALGAFILLLILGYLRFQTP